MNLSPAAFDLLLTTIRDIYAFRTLQQFQEALPSLMLRAIKADHFAYHVCTLGPRPKYVIYEESEGLVPHETLRHWEETMEDHPFTQYFVRTGDQSPLRLSDFVPQSKFKDVPAIRENIVPLGIRYMMSAATVASHGMIGGLSFARRTRDFTETDRTMLDLLRPHVIQARQNAERIAALMASGAVRSLVEQKGKLSELTPREKEVGRWIALGKTNPEIAILLNASPRTIEKHVQSILAKLGVENRIAVALLLTAGPRQLGEAT